MKQRDYQKKVYKLSGVIEIVISMIMLVAVLAFSVGLMKDLYCIIKSGYDDVILFTTFLGDAFQVVIGIEFIKMLCKHTPATVVEVLMFAMARQMVVEHTSSFENLFCILGITILFLIRRFLFTESDKANHFQEQISEQKE
ncbi:MAG: transporter [Lachnospiraceae bacterium]|nr:transporter [Lachnospiraceae bacterium]